MADSSIDEPFILATYKSTLRGNKTSEIIPRTYASVSKRPPKSHEYVTIAAQADGIHILDVANLYPAISYTLGPSTFFSCQPVTVSSSNHISTTYAVISSSPELTSLEDAGRTIWIWETDSSSKTRQKPKRTRTIFEKGHVVHALYSCYELPERIMALSNVGSFSILDGESLEAKTCYLPPLALKVLYSWTFPRSIAVSGGCQPGALVVIISSNSSSSIHLCTLTIDEKDSISQTQETDIDLPSEKIIDASCNSSGFLSILTNDGILYSHNLRTPLSGSSSLEVHLSLQLTNFPFTSSPSNSVQFPTPISIHALTSSHILLASTHSNQDIILHIWDVQLAVLLASHSLIIPSSLSSASNLHLCLVSDSYVRDSKSQNLEQQAVLSGQAYLLVSSVPLPTSEPKGRKQNEFTGAGVEIKLTTAVFTVPYTVPKVSTIAAAVGRGHVSGPWLKDVKSSAGWDDLTHPQTVYDVEKNLMLAAVRDAVHDGRPQAAEVVFLNWTSTLKERTDTASTNLRFEYNFVQELLEIVLFPSSDPLRQNPPIKQAYAPEIIRFLLDQRVVNSGMLASRGGFLSALRMHADWKCIELAFNKVIDLTELEIIETLRVVLAHHRHSLQTTSRPVSGVVDAMQVDSAPSVATSQATSTQPMTTCPTLVSFLQPVVTYPTSRVPLLLSFRRCMQDPEDVTILLKILSEWIAKSSKAEMDPGHSRKMMPTKKDLKKTKEGVWVVTGRKGGRLGETEGKVKKTEVLPPLGKITNFIQTLLDSSFLLLLSHMPSHNILRQLSSQLTPEIAFAHAAQNLRGALEPFAIAQEKAVKGSFVSKEEREKDKQKVDWRQRKMGVGAVGGAGTDVGVYTLEELVL